MANTKQNTKDQLQSASPLGLIEQIMDKTRITPDSTEYGVAEKGVAQFISEILKSQNADTIINKVNTPIIIAKLSGKLYLGVSLIIDREIRNIGDNIHNDTPNAIFLGLRKTTQPWF